MAMDKKRIKELTIASIAFLIFIVTMWGPIPPTMTRPLYMLLGSTFLAMILWLGIGLNWTNYFILFTLAMNPALGANKVGATSFGNSTVFFFICAFALISALIGTGVTKRIAIWLCTCKLAQRGPWWRVFMIFMATFILCQGLASTTILVVSYTLVELILQMAGYQKGDDAGKMLMHGTGILAQCAMTMTPIAHVVAINAITYYQTYTNQTLDFFDFCLIGIPIGLLMFLAIFAYMRLFWKPDLTKLWNANYDSLRDELGPMTKAERVTLYTYIVAVIFWILPGLGKYVGLFAPFAGLANVIPPMLAITFLALYRVDGKPLFNYKQALTKDIPWVVIAFSATLNCLGTAMADKNIGFSAWAKVALTPYFADFSPYIFVCIVLAGSLVMTQFVSNNVTLSVSMAIFFPIAATVFPGKVSIVVTSILLAGTTNMGISTPAACNPIAMAENTGWTEVNSMWKHGWGITFILIILYCFVAYPFGASILGVR